MQNYVCIDGNCTRTIEEIHSRFVLHCFSFPVFIFPCFYFAVVADTGDVNTLNTFTPQDATTNPTLMLKSALDPEYKGLVDDALSYARVCVLKGY